MHTEGMLIKQEKSWALITKKDEERHQLFYADYATLADMSFDMLDRREILSLVIHKEYGTVTTYPR